MPRLPKAPNPSLERIEFAKRPADCTEPREEPRAIQDIIAREQAAEHLIVVPECVAQYHPIVKATRAAFRRHFADQYGREYVPTSEVFEINVSQGLLNRAFQIADTVVKALEARDWVLALDPRRGCTASLFDESIALSIVEPAKRSPYEPTPAEIKRKNETGHAWYRQYQYKSIGHMTLAADRDHYSWSTSISDTTNKPLQTRLNKFVIEASRLAWRKHEHSVRSAREDEAREQAAAVRRALEAHARNRRKAVVALKLEAQLHDDAEAIRRYQKAVSERYEGSEFETWSTWATQIADRLDPAVNGYLTLAEVKEAMESERDNTEHRGFGPNKFSDWR